ncbi:MAG TPA: alcohol dehydrogenase catalytic domain-containing protein [Candidatus Binataceae bacterium]|jgi:threonine dehydrogenase-like Zn-dependent dehydrogenase
MRALTLNQSLEFRHDYPDPVAPAGESLVKVTLAGICGTDLELARGYMGFSGIPGHEFVGVVVESADPSLIGQRVVGEINAGCRRCAQCAIGLERHCANRTVLGILGRDGSFAEYLRLPDENLISLPEEIEDRAAVFAEPLAAAYEIFEQVEIRRDHSILILGDGRLATLVALAMKAEGYAPIIGGHHREKLLRLNQLGLETLAETDLKGRFDVVVDCTGASAGFGRAIELTRPRGTLILKSTMAGEARIDLAPVVINEITVVGSRCGRLRTAIIALASRKIDPKPLVSTIYPLAEWREAFAAARSPSSVKILLRPS